MKRKVIKQGHNTYTLTLPIKWANSQGVKAGAEIDVIEQGKTLIINAENNKESFGKIEIDITGLPNQLIWRFISSAYRAGYDEIKINFGGIEDDKERFLEFSHDMTDWIYRGELPKKSSLKLTALDAVQAIINRFIGVEITEQRPNYVIVKQFGEISYNEFGNALRRIQMLLVSTGDDILTAIDKNDLSVLKSIHMIDTNLDRFEDYCLRVLSVKGYEDYKKTPAMYSTIFLLEMVGDEYKRIAQHALIESKNYGKPALVFFKDINSQIEAYNELFYSPTKQKAIKIFENDHELAETVKKLYPLGNNYEKELLHHLKKIARFMISLTELAIDLKCESCFAVKN
ncbi:MAG: hypothetical protein NTY48_04990 [Candidatus Diapherotrites archaeon]|nr:hypothetical protein [Candidatus Diapherotrites archaeon]